MDVTTSIRIGCNARMNHLSKAIGPNCSVMNVEKIVMFVILALALQTPQKPKRNHA